MEGGRDRAARERFRLASSALDSEASPQDAIDAGDGEVDAASFEAMAKALRRGGDRRPSRSARAAPATKLALEPDPSEDLDLAKTQPEALGARRNAPPRNAPIANARRREPAWIEEDGQLEETLSEEEFAREAAALPKARRGEANEESEEWDRRDLATRASSKRKAKVGGVEVDIGPDAGWYAIALLAAAIFYTIFSPYLTWDPYSLPDDHLAERESGGTVLNQVFWLALSAACLPMALRRLDALFALVRRHWVLFALLFWCWASMVWSAAPDVALRRVIRLTIVVGCLTLIAASLPSAKDMLKACLLAMGAIILADLATLVVTPGLAFNSAGEFIGVHTNKNVCGAFALVATTIFAYAAIRTGGDLLSLAVNGAFALAAFAILILSGSKTSFAIPFLVLPFTMFASWAARSDGFSTSVVYALGLIGVALFALVVWGMGPSRFAELVFGDATLTGRTYIWDFLVQKIAQAPWLGHGYASFWSIGPDSPNIREGVGVVARISQGHNGYLDTLVTLGPVGLVLSLWAILGVFVGVVRHAGDPDDTVEWAGVALALAATALIHNVTESSIVRSDHLMWVMTVIAILYSPPGPKTVIAQARVQSQPQRRRKLSAEARRERLKLRRDTDL